MKNRRMYIGVQILFATLAFSILFTFYYLVTNSLKTNYEFAQSQFGLPTKPTFQNFVTVWESRGIRTALMNTAFLSGATVGVTLLFGSLAAYVLAVIRSRWSRFLFLLFIAMMYISPMSVIIPVFLQMIKLKLVDNLYGMVIIYSGLWISYTVFLATTYFRAVPRSVIDGARIDGCGDLRILLQVVIPISKAGFLILGLLVFFHVWSDLLWAIIFLRSESNWTLMVAIGQYEGEFTSDFTQIMAILLVSVIPPIIIYLFIQKYFTRGIISGSFR